jgi:hypothetical protein
VTAIVAALIGAAVSLAIAFGGAAFGRKNRLSDIRRTVYTRLLGAGYAALDFHEQRPGMLPAVYDDALAAEINSRTDQLLTELHLAIADVEVAGSRLAAEWMVQLASAAHGSVNSRLFRWAGEPPDPDHPWQYGATGVGPAPFHEALTQFKRIARHELTPMQKRLDGRWWQPVTRVRALRLRRKGKKQIQGQPAD